MKIKLLISLNSESINFGVLAFSLGFIFTFIQFGIIGTCISIFFAYQIYLFLNNYQVYFDDSQFYFSRYLTTNIEISKIDLIEVTIKKRLGFFIVYSLRFKSDKEYRFVEIPKSLLGKNSIILKEIIKEIVFSNSGNFNDYR